MNVGSDSGASRRHVGAHRSRPVTAGLIAAALGVLMLVVAAVIWWRSEPSPNVGVATVNQLASSSPASPSPASPSPASPSWPPGSSPPGSLAPVPAVPIQPGSSPTGTTAAIEPARLSIPKLHVTAKVVASGIDSSGDFSVPEDVSMVGWYAYGPGLDATAGSLVIGGHVDSAKQGLGAFFRLRLLNPGDLFAITGTDGKTRAYRVVAREEYPKTTIQLGRYFTWSGSPRVTLMTCGGSFDRAKHSYRDNIAITAVAVG